MARLTGDSDLLASCERLWRNIVDRKLYITGGIGATHMGEAFSFDYDLPNDTAYSESCAAIALAFFARRMLEIQPKSEYADVMESALYNTTLAGMALDGKSFFYVNPLEVVPEACHRDERKAHVKPVRQKWFGCACCPPNIARIVEDVSSRYRSETTHPPCMCICIWAAASMPGFPAPMCALTSCPICLVRQGIRHGGLWHSRFGFRRPQGRGFHDRPPSARLGRWRNRFRCGHRARPRRHLPRHQRRIPVSDRRMA